MDDVNIKLINQMIEEYRDNGHFTMIDEVKNMLAFCLEN